MAMRSAILAVLLLAVGSHAMKSVESTSLTIKRAEPPACDLCEGFVTSMSKFLADPKTEHDVEQVLENVLCKSLPAEFYDTCVQELGVIYTQVVATIVSAMDPADVCGALGVCPGALAAASNGPFDCPMCRMVALTLLQRFKDPKAREDMHKAFLEACDDLEPIKKPKCILDVNALFASLEAILDDLDPDMACEVTQFCPKPGVALARPAAFAAMRPLWTGLLASHPSVAVGDDASCQNCKVIVLQAVAILQNPKTQMEVIEYAKESCNVFGDWQVQCEQYVTLYGPLFINMLITYLQPDAICTELGYCPASFLA